MPTNGFTVQQLLDLGTLAFIVYLIVAFTKGVVKKQSFVSTQAYAYFVSFAVYLAAQAANVADMRVPVTYLMAFFNAFLITLMAGAAHDKAQPTVQNLVGQVLTMGSGGTASTTVLHAPEVAVHVSDASAPVDHEPTPAADSPPVAESPPA